MATKDLTSMTLDELNALSADLTKRRDELSLAHKAVSAEISRRMAEQEAQRKFEAMSDDERAALVQIVQAGGVASSEAPGAPKAG